MRQNKRKRKQVIGWSKVLTSKEQQMLMLYLMDQATDIKGRRLCLVCDVLLNTGLRVTELCDLRVRDTPFGLGRNVIEVYRGKNDKDRTVPIGTRLAKEVKKYINSVRPKTVPRHVNRNDVNKPLFYSPRSQPYKRHALNWAIGLAARKAGITKPITPHKLRHTFATNTLTRGVHLDRLRRLMGHSNIVTTSKYLDIVEELDTKLGEQIDRSFDRTLW